MLDVKNIKISEYSYNLPEDRIAKFPLKNRDESKLLIYKNGQISHDIFKHLDRYLNNTLLVLNNTKVIYARLIFHKSTGARIEIFLLYPNQPADYEQNFQSKSSVSWTCIVGNLRKWKNEDLKLNFTVGTKEYTLVAHKLEVTPGGDVLVSFNWNGDFSFSEIIEHVGVVPIPPYLNRQAVESDKLTYQTVYSKQKGSVAAPTAGLHFTQAVFDKLKNKGIDTAEVTLHVGAGTFKPVKSQVIGGHKMHTEYFTVQYDELKKIRNNLGKITAVGTTTTRCLESLYWIGAKIRKQEQRFVAQWEPYETEADISVEQAFDNILDYMRENDLNRFEAWTQIIIVPGYKFRVIDALITNFHQPQSTLLLLIAAFVGDDWKKIYQYALDNNFRFLSYGDSSLLFKNQ